MTHKLLTDETFRTQMEILNKKELLKNNLQTQLTELDGKRISACFKLLSDYVNELMYEQNAVARMRETVAVPANKRVRLLAFKGKEFVKNDSPILAFSTVVEILNMSDYMPSYNECVLIKDIISCYAHKTQTNLGKIVFDCQAFNLQNMNDQIENCAYEK